MKYRGSQLCLNGVSLIGGKMLHIYLYAIVQLYYAKHKSESIKASGKHKTLYI